ncbi:hypothetical protein BJ742DRAFT_764702 [Cladochytrium replicatum]|nr:hypothetical protein BJ742DRAFT_764702 [Cladochytrium replicatum]
MRLLGLSFIIAAGAGIAEAIAIGRSGKVIVKIDSAAHASGRFTLPVLSNGRTAAAEIVQIPAADFIAAIVPVSSQADIEALQKAPGVVRVYEDKYIPGPKRPTAIAAGDDSVTDANVAHKLTGVLEARKKFGVSGMGIKVGIIDTGVDWKHPALGGGTKFPTAKVAYGFDFVGDDYNGSTDNAVPKPDPDPMDCNGHGTHVAGIVAANSTSTFVFTGVAPDVTLGAYRIFGCEGGVDTATIIKAVQRAFDDGMDIINMSLGGDGGFPHGLDVDLIDSLIATGKIIFAIAQGNAQGDGVWQSSSPAIAERAIAVAATSNFATVRTRGITVAGTKFDLTVYDDTPVNAAFDGDVVLNALAAPAAGTASNADGCTGTANAVGVATNPTGKVLVIRRGTCAFNEKILNAQAAGAVALIIYNHGLSALPALQNFAADPSTGITIPVYTMEAEAGSALATLLLKTSGTSKIAFDGKDSKSVVSPVNVATFTSWGPGPDLSFKPDVAAPGTNILSTLPLAKGGFGLLSGTSMATPYTAGILALYLHYAKIVGANQPPTSTVITSTVTAGGGYSTIGGDDITTTPGTSATVSPVKCIPRPTPAYGRLARRADSPSLLKELFSTDPLFVRTRLQNAGKLLTFSTSEFLDTALLQGSGLIQVPQLLGTRVVASPGKIALGSFQSAQSHEITIKNYDSVAQKVSLSSEAALIVDVSNSNKPGYSDADFPVTFSVGGSAASATAEVELAPGASATVKVNFTPSSSVVENTLQDKSIILVSGWLRVGANGVTNTVSFAGLVGDRRNIDWTDESPLWVVDGKDTEAPVQGTLASLSNLAAKFRLIVPAAKFEGLLLDGKTREVIGTALSEVELSRNSNDATGTFFEYTLNWNLTYTDKATQARKTLTPGSYVVSLQLTWAKAFNEDTAPVSPKLIDLPLLTVN